MSVDNIHWAGDREPDQTVGQTPPPPTRRLCPILVACNLIAGGDLIVRDPGAPDKILDGSLLPRVRRRATQHHAL